MRRPLSACLVLALLALAFTAPALAQGTPPAPSYNMSWSALDPGTDWSAQVILSIFPVSPAPGGAASTGAAATVIGALVGTLTGFVAAIAMAWLCYGLIMQIFRGAETARVLDRNMSAMFLVRMGFAAVMMYPLSTGFSAGQKLVVQTALWGAGMAKSVYAIAVKAVGPDAMLIAQPIIPGTKTIVANLIQNELCRALVNAASAQPGLVPVPTPSSYQLSSNVSVLGAQGSPGGYTTWVYGLSAGNWTGSATCGTVTVRTPRSSNTTIAGVNVDMTGTQQTILTNVIAADIRPQVEAVAKQLWDTKKASALAPLQGVLTTATNNYSAQLTAAAKSKVEDIRTALQNAAEARDGGVGLATGMTKLADLGWTQAGAYYLEFARLNGQTLSLLNATPVVNPPSYDGLGRSLSRDLAPVMTSATAFMTKLKSYVGTNDGLDVPGGNADLFSSVTPGDDGAGAIEQLFRSMRLNESLLALFTSGMLPTSSMWTDPFSTLMKLGNDMATISLAAFGLAGLLNSQTGTAATAVFSLLSGNPVAAGTAVVGHFVVSFLATPIFAGLLAILVPGLVIAFVLPLIPWLMFLAGVIGWLVLVCEAVIAVPLWMLAHLTFQGEGMHGRAQEGYALLFNVLTRPTLMIVGLFLGYHVFAASSYLIRQGFGIAAGFVLANGWLVTNVIGVAVMLCIFVMAHVTAALLSFRMITLLPHHLPKLIGFASSNRVDMEQFGRDAAMVGTIGALRTIQGGLTPRGLGQAGQAKQLGGNGGARALPAPGQASQAGAGGAGVDSALQAATDVPPQQEASKEG